MILVNKLAQRLLDEHPEDAATALEVLPADEVAKTFVALNEGMVARIIKHMSPHRAAPVLELLPQANISAILEAMPTDAAATLLRRSGVEFRNKVLETLAGRAGRTLRTVLKYSPHSAATRMDPHVLALPVDLSVEQALVQVRAAAKNVLFNVYVVDRENILVGVLNLRELLSSEPQKTLRDIMKKPSFRIAADADRRAILEHPGWQEVHSLPVVDAKGRFLGALRYRMLQRLQLSGAQAAADRATASALGELFRTGAEGALTALTTRHPHRSERSHDN